MKAGRAGLMAIMLLAVCLPRAYAADFSSLAFRPHPGARLPFDLALYDEHGRRVALGQFFTGKPVILVLEYLHCRILCGVTFENLAASLDALPLDAGTDFQVVAVSVDPRDTAADAAMAKAKRPMMKATRCRRSTTAPTPQTAASAVGAHHAGSRSAVK